MKIFKKFLVLALALMLTLFAVFGCAPTEEPKSDGAFVPKEAFNVTVPKEYSACKEISDASVYLRRAFKAVYGMQCTAFDSAEEGMPEVLIGDTGREESDTAMAGLGVNDYHYEIVSEKLIVIAGGSLSATKAAVERFCLEVLGYDGAAEAEDITLTVGTKKTHKDSYGGTSATVNGVPLGEICVAVRGYSELSLIQPLIKELGSYTGEHVRVVTYDELKGDERGVICIGSLDREGERVTNIGKDNYRVALTNSEGGFTASLCALNAEGYADAIKAFFDEAEKTAVSGKTTLNIADVNKIKCVEFEGLDEWVLKSTSEKTVAEGVKYVYYAYEDQAGKPYKVYVMEVDPKYADLYMGTGNDGYEFAPTVKQTVKGHIESAVKGGKVVYGGINGDFFRISDDYSPVGLAIKEGQVISDATSNRPYVVFTKDGKCVIDTAEYADSEYEIRTAVGGSHLLLKDGMPGNVMGDDEFSVTPHPRTMLGIKKDGKILLVVVDGRQSKLSNGAPMRRCAKIMNDLGAYDAINLDGGGSSTMLTVKDGTVITENSPSDGVLRRVYNSLLVIKKQPVEE